MNEYKEHLTEEQLMDSLSGNINDEIKKHIDNCEVCKKEIDELLQMQQTLQGVDDESVPEHIEHQIFRSIEKSKTRKGIFLLENPLFIITMIIFMVLFFYFLLGAVILE